MAAGDVLQAAYPASSALTQTNLDGLASSATWVGVWESAEIVNTTNKYTDYRITAKLQVESTGLSAGEIRMGVVGRLDDSTWPDVFDGTESAETITDTELRDAVVKWGAGTQTDTTASRVYYLEIPSVAALFNYNMPAGFVVVIAQSTGNTLETTGDPNQVYVKGSFLNVAQ